MSCKFNNMLEKNYKNDIIQFVNFSEVEKVYFRQTNCFRLDLVLASVVNVYFSQTRRF